MADLNFINTYIQSLNREMQYPEAREHAYRPALKTLLEALGNFHAVNDAASIKDVGAPDFIIKDRDNLNIAFVEAKDVGIDLDKVERTDQLQRYFEALPNLILTDYVEFRWYLQGERQKVARLGYIKKDHLSATETGKHDVLTVLQAFLNTPIPTIENAEELAEILAKMGREIVRLLETALPLSQSLHSVKDLFEQILIPDLSDRAFADMYAQTLVYGLFAARTQIAGQAPQFHLDTAFRNIPNTNPFLHDFFYQVVGKLDPMVKYQAELAANVLAVADTDAILEGFGRRTRQEDPIIHFYETFLAKYDPNLREKRGVYYTPEPVVDYMVRSVDTLLKDQFGLGDGLADGNVYVLDPATGTGTFLYFVIQHIYEWVVEQNQQRGLWSGYVEENLLPRLFGFELLIAPYAIAHMKLGIQLQETMKKAGLTRAFNRRLGVYLTNTLERVAPERQIPFAEFLVEESKAAAQIKQEQPIMVVLGNPPYAAHSANTRTWVMDDIRQFYYPRDTQHEQNPKLLMDDYVKFIRFGQWRIERTGQGILAFITNNGYLDNPTFRQMRHQLMETFSAIYIVNLHGNSRKKETAPDGGPDENVFDIQQGVSIVIFVKAPHHKGTARIYYHDLYGKRKPKYTWLMGHNLTSTDWIELSPQAPFYLFVPYDTALLPEYEAGWKVTDIFPIHSTGIKTHRDHFVIDIDEKALKKRIQQFRDTSVSDERIMSLYDLKDTRDRKIQESRQTIQKLTNWEDFFDNIIYRPFDTRAIYFHKAIIELPRLDVMRHIIKNANIALVTTRQTRDPWCAFVTNHLSDHKSVAAYDTNYFFPLYLYPNGELMNGSPWAKGKDGRTPNLNPKFITDLEQKLALTFVSEGQGDLASTFGPEALFHYLYAVFHSPSYRERYAEFLKLDFPRIPLTSDKELFKALCGYGETLVKLHTMEDKAIGRLETGFEGEGERVVANKHPQYVLEGGESGRVYINPHQYIEGVAPSVWNFQVGGYQVLEKWLKDRKGRQLSVDEITHYQKIVVALRKTMVLMEQIDAAIGEFPIT